MPSSSAKNQKGGATEKEKEMPDLNTSPSSPSKSRRARDDSSMSPEKKKRKNSTSSSPSSEAVVPDASSSSPPPSPATTPKQKRTKAEGPCQTTTNEKRGKAMTKKGAKDEEEKKQNKAVSSKSLPEEASLSPLLAVLQEVAAEDGDEDLMAADASGVPAAGPSSSSSSSLLLSLLQRSKVIAPDCSGIRAVAVHPDETNFVVARENGSLMRVEVEYFQNMPHFTVVRHTGGCRRHTVTSMHYWKRRGGEGGPHERTPPSTDAPHTMEDADASHRPAVAWRTSDEEADVLIVTYLSGQMVLYDSETLFPFHVHQRTGGALWGSSWVPSSVSEGRLWTAVGDGSWQLWRLSSTASIVEADVGGSRRLPRRCVQFELEHVLPRVVGSQRALSVHAHPTTAFAAGTDDGGHVLAWQFLASTSREDGGMGRRGEDARTGHMGARKDRDAEADEKEGRQEGGHKAEALIASSLRGGRRDGRVEVLWTSKLPKGMGLCCCVCMGGGIGVPVVAVGSTSGDVVLLDLMHDGHIHAIFSHHRGPVSSIVASSAEKETALYATGWHEALRCYRCDTHHPFAAPTDTASSVASVWGSVTADGHPHAPHSSSSSATFARGGGTSWTPAEVKRRTHYHEAMQLVMLPQRHLLLSASRDGTVLYAGLQTLFTSPANYLPLTTQQFAFCHARNMLLSTRYGRIEVFQPDTAGRHWRPVFAYASHGRYHLSGLWCDTHFRTVVYSTDERVVVLRVSWKNDTPAYPRASAGGKGMVVDRIEDHHEAENEEERIGGMKRETGESIRRIEEHVQLPAKKGLLDVLFYDMTSSPSPVLGGEGEKTPLKREPKRENDGRKSSLSSSSSLSDRFHTESRQMVYLLFDDGILTLPSTEEKEAIDPVFTSFDASPLSSHSSSAPVAEKRKERPRTPHTNASPPTRASSSPPSSSTQQSPKDSRTVEWNEEEEEIGVVRGSDAGHLVGSPGRRLFWHPSSTTFSSSFRVLVVSGPAGSWMMAVSTVDGRIIASSLQFYRHKQFHLPHTLPMIGVPSSLASPPTTVDGEDSMWTEGGGMAALSLAENRYVCGSSLFSEAEVEKMLTHTSLHPPLLSSSSPEEHRPNRLSSTWRTTTTTTTTTTTSPLDAALSWRRGTPLQPLPSTLPHDTVFVAQVHPASFPLFSTYFPALAAPSSSSSSASSSPSSHDASSEVLLIGYFRRGVLLSTTKQWKMIYRGNVEAAFVLPGSVNSKGDAQNAFDHRWIAESEVSNRASRPHKGEEGILEGKLLILERNLEKALESMPLTWKVRRFGN